jgi:hypothetical protein
MSDGELLCLAADRQDLLVDAVIALDHELAKRGLRQVEAKRFKRNAERIAARDVVGRVGLSLHGIGKQFIGASQYVSNPQTGFEEFNSTLWVFFSFFPILPLSTVRIRRKLRGRSIFWAFGSKDFTPLGANSPDFMHVAVTYLGAAAAAYGVLRLLLFLLDSIILR